MAHLSGFAGGQHVNDNKCGESVDKLTALCSERKTIKGVLVALMRPLLTLGVLSMEVRVVEATSCTRHSCHPWLSPRWPGLLGGGTLLVNIPRKLLSHRQA